MTELFGCTDYKVIVETKMLRFVLSSEMHDDSSVVLSLDGSSHSDAEPTHCSG